MPDEFDKYLTAKTAAPDEFDQYLSKPQQPALAPNSATSIGAEPTFNLWGFTGIHPLKISKSTVRSGLGALPAVVGAGGAIAGGILGGGAGAIPGAYLGGASGDASKQLLERLLGIGPPPSTSSEAASSILGGGEQQALIEATGQVAGRALKPLVGPLKESAIKSMTQVLGPTKQAMKLQAAKVAPGLVERGIIARSRSTLTSKVVEALDRSGAALDAALDATPSTLKPDKKAAIAELEDYKNRFLVRRDVTSTPQFDAFDVANQRLISAQRAGAYPTEIASLVAERDAAEQALAALPKLPGSKEAANAVAMISNIQKSIAESDPSFFGLRNLRGILDRIVDKDGNYVLTKSEFLNKELNRRGADSIRRILADASPDVAAVNKEFSFWKSTKDIITETNLRTASQIGGLRKSIAGIAGASAKLAAGGGAGKAGLTGAALYSLQSLFDSTAWRTTSAFTKDRLAKAIMIGNSGQVISMAARLVSASQSSKKKLRPEER